MPCCLVNSCLNVEPFYPPFFYSLDFGEPVLFHNTSRCRFYSVRFHAKQVINGELFSLGPLFLFFLGVFPMQVHYVPGGVARNIAECTSKLGTKPYMISALGLDMAGVFHFFIKSLGQLSNLY